MLTVSLEKSSFDIVLICGGGLGWNIVAHNLDTTICMPMYYSAEVNAHQNIGLGWNIVAHNLDTTIFITNTLSGKW